MKLSTIFILLALLGFLGMAYMHEQTHVQIFASYGIESRIDLIGHFPDFVTIPEENCPSEICELAHNNSDSLMYPLGIVYFVGVIGFYILLAFLEMLIDLQILKLKKVKC